MVILNDFLSKVDFENKYADKRQKKHKNVQSCTKLDHLHGQIGGQTSMYWFGGVVSLNPDLVNIRNILFPYH